MILQTRKQPLNLLSSCIMLVVVLAFAVKAVLPAGFMPVLNKDGFTEIVICSGMGEKTIKVPAEENAPADHPDENAGEVCAYQVLASGKILLSPLTTEISAPVIEAASPLFFSDGLTQTLTTYSLTARGPPSV